ncbi:MAG: hypothetical protein ACK4N5_01995 [Myxococcales bacterium]
MKRLLVAEDERDLLGTLEAILVAEGYAVRPAPTADRPWPRCCTTTSTWCCST